VWRGREGSSYSHDGWKTEQDKTTHEGRREEVIEWSGGVEVEAWGDLVSASGTGSNEPNKVKLDLGLALT
jgi:hypothetical protein